MSVLFIEEKKSIWPYVSIMVVIALVIVVTFSFWNREEKRDGVILAKSALQGASIASPFTNTEATHFDTNIVSEETTLQPKFAQSAQTAPPPPRYGMDAIGEPGAWDGGGGEVTLRNNCEDASKLSIVELSTLAHSGQDKNCNYYLALKYRADLSPKDFFMFLDKGGNFEINGFQLENFSKNGLWSLSDFEKLADLELSRYATLTLYGLLVKAGSSKAAYLANRNDGKTDRKYLDVYLKSKQCLFGPTEFEKSQLDCAD